MNIVAKFSYIFWYLGASYPYGAPQPGPYPPPPPGTAAYNPQGGVTFINRNPVSVCLHMLFVFADQCVLLFVVSFITHIGMHVCKAFVNCTKIFCASLLIVMTTSCARHCLITKNQCKFIYRYSFTDFPKTVRLPDITHDW